MAGITRSSYNRRIITFCGLLFLSIALISTGFAAWITSANSIIDKYGSMDVGVITEGLINIDDISLTNKSFSFNPLSTDINGRVRGDGENPECLSITVTGLINPADAVSNVKLELIVPDSITKACDDGYIVAPECMNNLVNITNLTLDEKTNSYIFSYTMTFGWGEVFNYMNPGIYFDLDPEGKNISNLEANNILKQFRMTMYGLSEYVSEVQPLKFTVEIQALA